MPPLTWAQKLYFVLVAIHLVAILISGALWTVVDLVPGSKLRSHLRDIQAVHFGSLYLVPTLLGLAWAFDRLRVPDFHQVVFPAGLACLVGFSSIGYLFPRPPGVNPFYYWTKGPAMVLALVGIASLVVAMIWTAVVLVAYSFAP